MVQPHVHRAAERNGAPYGDRQRTAAQGGAEGQSARAMRRKAPHRWLRWRSSSATSASPICMRVAAATAAAFPSSLPSSSGSGPNALASDDAAATSGGSGPRPAQLYSIAWLARAPRCSVHAPAQLLAAASGVPSSLKRTLRRFGPSSVGSSAAAAPLGTRISEPGAPMAALRQEHRRPARRPAPRATLTALHVSTPHKWQAACAAQSAAHRARLPAW